MNRERKRFLACARNDDGEFTALPYFLRRTTISHFSFLISNFAFKRSFHPQSKDDTPHGLTLNTIQKTPSSAKDLPRTECIRGATLIHVIGHALSEVPAYFRQLTYALRRRILGFSFRCALCGPFGRLPSIHSHQVGLSVRAFPALISASTV